MSTARSLLMRRARRYLAIWKENIGLDNELGLTDINSDAEDFICGLLNIMLNASFRNLNLLQMNFPAVDLADREKRLCVQVTSTAGAEKVRHTLDRFFAHGLDAGYDRLIVMILGKKKQYRAEFPQKEGFSFDPARDVWDISTLLARMAGLTIPVLERVDDYLREQFDDLEELAPPMDLPVLSALDDRTFLGRGAELDAIARRFDAGEKIVFLSGLGGMGKSELAARFAQTRWGGESYFVRFTKSWKQTVVENIAPRIRGLNREGSDADRLYRDAMAELKSRGRDELLILDNVDDEGISLTQLKRDLSELCLRILITTRKDPEQALPVARLDHTELRKLFELHESVATAEEQYALIDAVDGHTLTVDLMARALRPGRRAATAKKLLANLADSSVRKVETAYSGTPSQGRIMEHLKVVFRVSALEENEQELLRYATLLPEGGMADGLFLSPLGDEMEDTLDSLVDNGWLRWQDGLLLIHPVIRKVCQEELRPNDENCETYINGLIDSYDEKNFRQDRCRQLAELLTNASSHLADADGRWALKAGERWGDIGAYSQALDCDLLALKHIQENPTLDDSALAEAFNDVGCTYGDLGEYKTSLEYLKKTLEILESLLPPDHPDLALTYNNIGGTYDDLGNHRKALEYQRKALRIREKILPPNHLDLATSYNNVGGTYASLGNHQKALEYMQKALEIRQKALIPDHPDLASSYNSVGSIYGSQGNYQAALKYQRKALKIREMVLPPDHPDLASSYNNVGCTYGDLCDHEKELDYQLKALAIRQKVLPPGHPELAQSFNNVGIAYGNLGEYEKALEYKQKDLAIMEKMLLPEHPHLATSYNNIGCTYDDLERYKEALECHQKALAIQEKILPPNHPDLAASYNNIAWTYYNMGEFQNAAQHMHRAAEILSRSNLPPEHPNRVDIPETAAKFEQAAKLQQDMLSRMQNFGTNPFGLPKK